MKTLYLSKSIIIRDSIPDDIQSLSSRLRESDQIELSATGETPKETLTISYNISSIRLSMLFKDKVICMFGIVPETLLGEQARVWCLGSDEIDQIKLTFTKLSKPYIRMFLEYYPVLENWVDLRYTRSINWLKWCGAEFDLIDTAKDGTPFQHFTIRR